MLDISSLVGTRRPRTKLPRGRGSVRVCHTFFQTTRTMKQGPSASKAFVQRKKAGCLEHGHDVPSTPIWSTETGAQTLNFDGQIENAVMMDGRGGGGLKKPEVSTDQFQFQAKTNLLLP